MKLDILIPDFQDLGAQRVAINAANVLAQKHDVRFVVNQADGPFRAYLKPDIPLICLDDLSPSLPKLRVLNRLLTYAFKVAAAERIAISYAPITNLAVLMAKLARGCKVMIQEHTLLSAALRDKAAYGFGLRAAHYGILLPWYRYADSFVVISQAIREDLINTYGLPGNYMTVIPNPIDLTRIEVMGREPLPKGPWQRRDFILGIGRLVDQKDFSRLISIFSQVSCQFPNLDLVILGKGEREAILRAETHALGLGERIHFAGFQQNPYAFLTKARAFCLTSLWEGLPQVLAEAMACGTPVIAHSCPSGPSEMISNQTGWLTPYQNNEAFLEALTECMSNPIEAEQRGAAGKLFAKDNYALETYCQRLEKKLISLIAR